MIRPGRVFFVVLVLILAAAAVPVSKAISARSNAASALKTPLSLTSTAAQTFQDLLHFRANAQELRALKASAAARGLSDHQAKELLLENRRLVGLLEMRQSLPSGGRGLVARVIGRSPTAWNRVFLIDKGAQQGIRVNQPVLSGQCLIGKVAEVGPSVAKVVLVTDPSSRTGVLLQRTRQQGVLFGTVAGGARIKYLSVEPKAMPGDVVETAGFGGSIPKGLLIGKITRAWKEPGQIYQVAEVVPAVDLGRIEEVICLA